MPELIIGVYSETESLLHRLDARIKLLCILIIIAALFSARGFISIGFVGLGIVLAWSLAGMSVQAILKRQLVPFIFALFPLVFNLLFVNSGTLLLAWGPLHITDAGLFNATYLSLRLFLMFSAALLVSAVSSPLQISSAIGHLLAPFERFGLPAYEISLMIGIALRFIPDFIISFQNIQKAQRARGAVFNAGSPLRRLRALAASLVPLFAMAFRHAEELALAMESRCYHGGSERSYYREMTIGKNDARAVGAVLGLLLGAIALRLAGL